MSDHDQQSTPRVGIIGGGQLALMLAQSVKHLSVESVVLDPSDDCCARQACAHIRAPYDDKNALKELAGTTDVVTYEFENVPGQGASLIAQHTEIHPNPQILTISQDRLTERAMFEDLGIAVPNYASVSTRDELASAIDRLGAPSILKARTLGYDGKGQSLISDPDKAPNAWDTIGNVPAILDEFVEFYRELSIIATRSKEGNIVFYPLSENVHRGGILRLSRAPAQSVSPKVEQQAKDAITSILERFEYVGTLAVEFFQIGTGDDATLVANEIAPRVHNTGHWTIEGAQTSQFENHMRAVLGRELGSPDPIGHSAMINIISEEVRDGALDAMPEAHIHMYGKEPRPGRKLGHITLNAPTIEELETLLERYTRVIG